MVNLMTLLERLRYFLFYRSEGYKPRYTVSRTEIINRLIKRHAYESYLEIGVAHGKNFEAIEATPPPTALVDLWQADLDRYKHFRKKEQVA